MPSKIARRLRSLTTQLKTSLTMTTTAFAALAAVSIGSQVAANATIGGVSSVTDLAACALNPGDESAGTLPHTFDKRPGLCHVLNPSHDIDEPSGQ